MLAVPGRSGWWALPESRPATPASPPGAAALQPPSSLGGSGAGQVGVGCALRCSPGAQNSFHSGKLSILKFLPASCKTAAAGNVAWYGHRHVQTNGETDRQIEGEGRTGKRRVLKNRDGDTKMVFLRSKKGKIPLFPHSCLSVFSSSLYIRQAECGQISTDRCSFTERRETHNRSLRQMGSALPKSERGVGKTRLLGSLPREQEASSRFPGRAKHAAAKGSRSSLPRDFVPVAADWVPCNISRSALTGSHGEGNRASLAHLAFPPTPGGV